MSRARDLIHNVFGQFHSFSRRLDSVDFVRPIPVPSSLFIYLYIHFSIPLQYYFHQGHPLPEITDMTVLLLVLDR
jgi:hypothetical protein